MAETDKKTGPLGLARQEQDKRRSEELVKAYKIIGNLLSQTEMRNESFPMLYDIWIKMGGLLYAAT